MNMCMHAMITWTDYPPSSFHKPSKINILKLQGKFMYRMGFFYRYNGMTPQKPVFTWKDGFIIFFFFFTKLAPGYLSPQKLLFFLSPLLCLSVISLFGSILLCFSYLGPLSQSLTPITCKSLSLVDLRYFGETNLNYFWGKVVRSYCFC
ncbi:hypothetical protein AMTRI_Chr03g149510 [Amborella trichopoda]